jgi:choline dehydrogenase-like flavoprotein
MTQLDCDILIVGSGAAGGVLAATFAERTDKRIVLLEKGGHYERSFFNQRELDMGVLMTERGGRSSDDGAFPIVGGECVGGGTTVNFALCFDPIQSVWERWRSERSLDGFSFDAGANDYGIAGLNMRKALADVRSRLNVHIPGPEAINDNNRLFAAGAEKLGIGVRPFELNMRNCIGCGFCGQGCAYDAKQSTLVTYVRDAVARGVQLVHHCDVEAVVLDRSSGVPRAVGVRGVIAQTANGSEPNSVPPGPIAISAKLVILSAGAVSTPALLQRSEAPDPSDVIGRGLVLHPSLPLGGLFDRRITNYQNIAGTYYSDHFHATHGLMLECLFDHPVNTSLAVPSFGREHFETMLQYRNLAGFGVMLVDSVDPNNRVTWKASSGKASIHYALAGSDVERLRFGARRSVEIMFAAGAREVFLASDEPIAALKRPHFSTVAQSQAIDLMTFRPYQTLLASAHCQASAKMGADPRNSVFNARGEAHNVRNLIGCDSSVFPSSCGANPMIAIMTMARYQGLRIAGEWQRYA